MEIKANLNRLHIAPRKARLVADLIRGMNIQRAILELQNLPKRSSSYFLKLLKSAAANARNNFQLEEKGLYIKGLRVDAGPMLKRFKPRAFGRAAMIRKKTSCVSLILDTMDKSEIAGRLEKQKLPKVVYEEGPQEESSREVSGHSDKKGLFRVVEKTKIKKTKGFMQRMFRRKAI